MRVHVIDFFLWNRALWRDDLTTAVADYLRRSKEEITQEEEWTVLNAAMLGQRELQLLVAMDGETLLGFAVLRVMPGTQVTGTTINLWQAYVWPGRAKLEDLFEAAYPLIAKFAMQWQAKSITLSTRRMSEAYARVLARLGFQPYLRTYIRGVFTSEVLHSDKVGEPAASNPVGRDTGESGPHDHVQVVGGGTVQPRPSRRRRARAR